MTKTIASLERELSTLKAGRANPQALDRIFVDYYGAATPINQLGNISAPEPRMLGISLWDSKMIGAVEKAILKSDVGITPSNDGKVIRLMLPELTAERRKELTKLVRKTAEESKVAIRNIRRDAMDKYKALEKQGELTEDDRKEHEKEIQDITDKRCKEIDVLTAEKEKELIEAMKAMLGIYAKVKLVAPKSITRSEGKAVHVIDNRKLY